MKVDATGTKQWDKTLGGSSYDNLAALQQTKDGGYILGGSSNSGISGDKTEANKGSNPSIITADYWIVKLCTQRTFYRDNDSDGYGNASVKIQSCTAPAGYVSDSTDCNDSNAAVHPGAVEICGNGIDDNCNGQIDEGCSLCSNATRLSTTSITEHSAKLNWIAPANPAQWQVQYKKIVTGSKWTTLTLPGTARSVTIHSLSEDQSYQWHIRAKCGTTWTAYGEAEKFETRQDEDWYANKVGSPAKEEATSSRLQVYPNPNKGQFTLRLNNSSGAKAEVLLMDASGAVVERREVLLTAGSQILNFNLGNKATGLYLVKLISEDCVQTAKFVVQR